MEMLDGVEKIFDQMKPMMKKLKKASYEQNMEGFRRENGHYFREMVDYVEEAGQKEEAAKEIAVLFTEKVGEKFGGKKKISGILQADLNFFMIYYVFPSILLTGSDCAKTTADAVCAEWGNRFKDSKINYADYDTIYKGFREKVFGIF